MINSKENVYSFKPEGMNDIENYIVDLNIKHASVGGFDKSDVYSQLHMLHTIYQSFFDSQMNKYKSQIREKLDSYINIFNTLINKNNQLEKELAILSFDIEQSRKNVGNLELDSLKYQYEINRLNEEIMNLKQENIQLSTLLSQEMQLKGGGKSIVAVDEASEKIDIILSNSIVLNEVVGILINANREEIAELDSIVKEIHRQYSVDSYNKKILAEYKDWVDKVLIKKGEFAVVLDKLKKSQMISMN